MATLTEMRLRAQRAKEVLENEEFIRVFATLKEELIRKIEISPIANQLEREKLCMGLYMLAKIKRDFESNFNDLKVLEHREAQLNLKGN